MLDGLKPSTYTWDERLASFFKLSGTVTLITEKQELLKIFLLDSLDIDLE